MTIHVTPIPSAVDFGTPAQVYTTANDPGSANTAMRTDSEVAVFDATVASTLAFSGSATTGTQAFASRRDHSHGMPANPDTDTHGLVLIGTEEADDTASLTVTGLSSTYDSYLIEIAGVIPATNNTILWMRVGDAAGIDSGTDNYNYHCGNTNSGATDYGTANVSGNDNHIEISGMGVGNVAGKGYGASIVLGQPGDSSIWPVFHGTHGFLGTNSSMRGGLILANRRAEIDLDRIQILFATGNITVGRLTVWGYAHA